MLRRWVALRPIAPVYCYRTVAFLCGPLPTSHEACSYRALLVLLHSGMAPVRDERIRYEYLLASAVSQGSKRPVVSSPPVRSAAPCPGLHRKSAYWSTALAPAIYVTLPASKN